MLNDLVKIANKLDSLGLQKEADQLDDLIQKIAVSYYHYDSPDFKYIIRVTLNKADYFTNPAEGSNTDRLSAYKSGLFDPMCQKVIDFLSELQSSQHSQSSLDLGGYRTQDLMTFPILVRVAPSEPGNIGPLESYSCKLKGLIDGEDLSNEKEYKRVWQLIPPKLDPSEEDPFNKVDEIMKNYLDKYYEDLKKRLSTSEESAEWIRQNFYFIASSTGIDSE